MTEHKLKLTREEWICIGLIVLMLLMLFYHYEAIADCNAYYQGLINNNTIGDITFESFKYINTFNHS